MFTGIDRHFGETGLFVRGGFHPDERDEVPPLSDGRPARTVLLVGNAGPALWHAIQADGGVDWTDPHPLDRWVMRHIRRVAEAVGAEALDPMKPPYVPIQRWARRGGGVYDSPLGLVIHSEYGLWHVYRGALLFAEALDLPPPVSGSSPCETCTSKPCLRACPVEAFQPDGFRMSACADHVEGPSGGPCRAHGCLARRACPIGRDWRYPDDECAYHMAAVVTTVRKFMDRGEVPAGARLDPPPAKGA